jgi:ABC-type multidrug transport system fused ATPase/permease subunit
VVQVSIFLRLFRLVLKYKKGVALAWLCVFGAAGFQLISPQLVQWAIDNGITKAQAQHYLLFLAAAGIFGAAAGRSLAQYGRQYLGQVLGGL